MLLTPMLIGGMIGGVIVFSLLIWHIIQPIDSEDEDLVDGAMPIVDRKKTSFVFDDSFMYSPAVLKNHVAGKCFPGGTKVSDLYGPDTGTFCVYNTLSAAEYAALQDPRCVGVLVDTASSQINNAHYVLINGAAEKASHEYILTNKVSKEPDVHGDIEYNSGNHPLHFKLYKKVHPKPL